MKDLAGSEDEGVDLDEKDDDHLDELEDDLENMTFTQMDEGGSSNEEESQDQRKHEASKAAGNSANIGSKNDDDPYAREYASDGEPTNSEEDDIRSILRRPCHCRICMSAHQSIARAVVHQEGSHVEMLTDESLAMELQLEEWELQEEAELARLLDSNSDSRLDACNGRIHPLQSRRQLEQDNR